MFTFHLSSLFSLSWREQMKTVYSEKNLRTGNCFHLNVVVCRTTVCLCLLCDLWTYSWCSGIVNNPANWDTFILFPVNSPWHSPVDGDTFHGKIRQIAWKYLCNIYILFSIHLVIYLYYLRQPYFECWWRVLLVEIFFFFFVPVKVSSAKKKRINRYHETSTVDYSRYFLFCSWAKKNSRGFSFI